MFHDISYLVNLYDKILANNATEEEKNEFDLIIKTSCINKQFLLDAIKTKSNEKRD